MTFAQDVRTGLSATQKHLSSKYFYDSAGDKIFQQIMDMPEYYLTRAEYAILENHSEYILNTAFEDAEVLNIVELGAGDGTKTRLLIASALQEARKVEYIPVDISPSVLMQCTEMLRKQHPQVEIFPMEADYFTALKQLSSQDEKSRLVLFLGSNIGNFRAEERVRFIQEMYGSLKSGDKVLIGFDLKKDPYTILAAYNDSAGYTKAFNLNMLHRINAELGGEFDVSKFSHYPTYDPLSGRAVSFLVSLEDQKVRIAALDQEFNFARGETIHTEISQKFDLDMIHTLAEETGFRCVQDFFDPERLFVDSLWAK